MKNLKLAVGVALACFALGGASASPFQRPAGMVGILSPDGTFRPMMQHGIADTTSASTVTGKLELSLSVDIQTKLPSKTVILCSLSASVEGISASGVADSIEETGEVPASVSGSTATCKPTIAYEWHLFANSSSAEVRDGITLSYQIVAVTADGGRTSTVSFATIAVPANNKTTSFSEAARL